MALLGYRVVRKVTKVKKSHGMGPNPYQKKRLGHRKHRAEDDYGGHREKAISASQADRPQEKSVLPIPDLRLLASGNVRISVLPTTHSAVICCGTLRNI